AAANTSKQQTIPSIPVESARWPQPALDFSSSGTSTGGGGCAATTRSKLCMPSGAQPFVAETVTVVIVPMSVSVGVPCSMLPISVSHAGLPLTLKEGGGVPLAVSTYSHLTPA